jgi:hypothetical protein
VRWTFVAIVGFLFLNSIYNAPVGARDVVHISQFNGKQEGRVARSTTPHLRCPRNGQADES